MEIAKLLLPSNSVLSDLEKLVLEMEKLSPVLSSNLVDRLRECVTNFPSKLCNDERVQVWKLSYHIWNLCVDFANNLQADRELEEDHARLRHIASDLLLRAGSIDGVDSCLLKMATFFYRTGTIWHKLKSYGMASVCFETATEVISKGQEDCEGSAKPKSGEEQKFLFDLYVARSKTAWELCHRALACSLLGRARGLLAVLPGQHHDLADHYFQNGRELLAKNDVESQSESITYMERAYEICSSAPTSNIEDPEKVALSNLKLKILRYLAAGHLQRENYESVLKCLAVLKLASDHPSTSYLAVKALAGLGRYDEAENELFALIRQPDASVEACLSGIEIILHDPGRLDPGKRAFFIVLSFHRSNKILPLRMLEFLLRRSPVDANDAKRVEMVLEIATNGNVVSTITGADIGGLPVQESQTSSGKEQQCVHALLWNSGSEHFAAKQYETSIKLFETSMLYLPDDWEGRLQRAKSLRVLCLCRLALLQYDRAAEYVNEAEKIDSNIASAFLKFKIYLQTRNEEAAVEQVEKMLNCPNFEPEYLCLASHEAMTSDCTKVSLEALSKLLSLPSDKRGVGTKEVVLIRNLVSLVLQDPRNHIDFLKYIKQAQVRSAEQGFETFFGSGNLGQQEANWFASTSWNQGLLAIKSQDWQLSADIFSCASEFISSLSESQENLIWLQRAVLLAASSLLASDSGESCVRSVSRMLDRCRKVHRSLAMSMDPTKVVDPTFEIHISLISFDLKVRTKDYKAQLDILYHCSTLPGFKSEYYLMAADHAYKEPYRSAEVASTAFRLALKQILILPSPDYQLVAMIIRKQITLADHQTKDGTEVLAAYTQAKEILAGLSPREYPRDEVNWLVSTSWNRAGIHVKFQRFAEAEVWMEAALDLINYSPHMESCRASMLESLNHVKQRKNSTLAVTD